MIKSKRGKHHNGRGNYFQFSGKKQGMGRRLLSRMDDMRRDIVSGAKSVKNTTLEIAHDIADLFADMSRIHGKLWSHRANRIKVSNWASHANSIVTLVLITMQIFSLLLCIKTTDGHIGNVKSITAIVIPALFAIGLNLLIQLSTLYDVLNRALNNENKSDMHPRHEELNRFLPVFEHLVVVVAYILFLVTVYAIGSCHLRFTPERDPTGICKSFDLQTVQIVMGIVVAAKVIHHIISIYNHYHHTSSPTTTPRAISSLDVESDIGDEDVGVDGVINKLCSVDRSIMEGWQFWKFRMNRIMSANVADNMCKIWGITFLGGFIIHLVTQIHNSHGNMGNIPNLPMQVWPLFTMFFGKALVQAAILLYVYCNHFPYERSLLFLQHFRDQPTQGLKVLEHFLPMITNIFFGVMTMAIGQCHLNPILNEGQTMCKIFSFEIVKAVIVVIAMIQFLHHILAMAHYSKHCDVPEPHQEKDQLEMTVDRSRSNDYRDDM